MTVPIDSSLAYGEEFPAQTVALAGGDFLDDGTLIANSLNIDSGAEMSLLPAGIVQLSENMILEAAANLDVQGQINVPSGRFLATGALASKLTIGPSESIDVGMGETFTLTSPTALSFTDEGSLDVGGNLTLQSRGGTMVLNEGTLKVDQYPLSEGVSLIDNAQGTVTVEASSHVVVAGNLRTPTLQLGMSGDGSVFNVTNSSITGEGHIDNQGTFDAGGGTQIGVVGDYLNDGDGAVTEIANGRLSFDSGSQATTIDSNSSGKFAIGTDGTLDLANNTSVGHAMVEFTGNSGVLAVASSISNFSNEVSGFSGTDELEIVGSGITSANFTGTGSVRVVEASGATLDFTDLFIQGLAAGPLAITNSGDNGYVLVCYLAGTKILTVAGEVSVEDLRQGMLVATRGSGFRPVQWMGRQSFCAPFLAAHMLPVRIHRNAIAPNVPN